MLPIIQSQAKPEHCYTSGCSLATKGKGFCLGYGNPETSMIALVAEAPGKNEIVHFLNLKDRLDSNELSRRQLRFPGFPAGALRKGAPLVGASGALAEQWILRAVGLTFNDVYRDNTLRCLPPKTKAGSYYPVGEERKKAEECCREYDRLDEFKPDIALITLHPAGILREVTPLSLVVEDMKKARDFAKQGYKVIVLMGGKAAKHYLGYGENVTKWRGHYTWINHK